MDVQYPSLGLPSNPKDTVMPPAAAVAHPVEHFPPQLSPFEDAFVRTVLEHRGLFRDPTGAEFAAAIQVLKCYDEQCADNPGGGVWEPLLDEDSTAALRAKAFLMFGATKPTPAQWHKAHTALFGPLLCETCG
jgi:hypothetical protein